MTLLDLPTLHAIYTVAGDIDLLKASIASIYGGVDGITIVTGYDRDWAGNKRDPGDLAEFVLSRIGDPDRKINLIVTDETNEARSRNRAMDFVAPRKDSLRVRRQAPSDSSLSVPNYFLIIDADEIYEHDGLLALRRHVAVHRRPAYRVPCVRYFKYWTFRVTGYEWAVSLVRADVRLPYLRLRPARLSRRLIARVPGLPQSLSVWLRRFEDISPAIAVFHHGSYVGPRGRIEEKLRSFGHAHEVDDSWLDRVWADFSESTRDFNPAYPDMFSRAKVIALEDLPVEIRNYPWPPGYLSG